MIEGTLVARKFNDNPIGYRVWFDDRTGELQVGSITVRHRHTDRNAEYWHWGVDTMPLLGGGTEPDGDTISREAALEAFREAFFKWINKLHPGDWQRNRDYIKAVAERVRKGTSAPPSD